MRTEIISPSTLLSSVWFLSGSLTSFYATQTRTGSRRGPTDGTLVCSCSDQPQARGVVLGGPSGGVHPPCDDGSRSESELLWITAVRLLARGGWRRRLLLLQGFSSSSLSSSEASRSLILLTAALAVFLASDLRTVTLSSPSSSEPWDVAAPESPWFCLSLRDDLLL